MSADVTRSVIGAELRITGEISTKGTIVVDGYLDGTVEAETLMVQKDGTVTGTVTADQIVIAGTVKGKVSARMVEIKAGARVEADIQHEQISVESGAALLGQIRRRHASGATTAKANSDATPAE